MIPTRSAALVIDTVVRLTLAKWETASGRFGGLSHQASKHLTQINDERTQKSVHLADAEEKGTFIALE